MDRKDQEGQEIIKQFEAREAGVAELAVFYERLEAVYIQASQTLQEESPVIISNSANLTR